MCGRAARKAAPYIEVRVGQPKPKGIQYLLRRKGGKITVSHINVLCIAVGRTAGEDKDNFAGEGSYLLTKTEEEMLETVCSVFRRTVDTVSSPAQRWKNNGIPHKCPLHSNFSQNLRKGDQH